LGKPSKDIGEVGVGVNGGDGKLDSDSYDSMVVIGWRNGDGGEHGGVGEGGVGAFDGAISPSSHITVGDVFKVF